MLPAITQLFDMRDATAESMRALMLQGFEAGREFQLAHPEVISGIGYLP